MWPVTAACTCSLHSSYPFFFFFLKSWQSLACPKARPSTLFLMHKHSCSFPHLLNRYTEQQLDYQHWLIQMSDWPQSVLLSPQIWLLRALTKAMNISLLCETLEVWPILEWGLFVPFVRVLLCNQQVLPSNEREEKFRLDIRNRFFTERVVMHWNGAASQNVKIHSEREGHFTLRRPFPIWFSVISVNFI